MRYNCPPLVLDGVVIVEAQFAVLRCVMWVYELAQIYEQNIAGIFYVTVTHWKIF